MKRLLLPLLAALALPTAVNANWFSDDFVVKTNLGEKFIVKKNTIEIEPYPYREFLLRKLDVLNNTKVRLSEEKFNLKRMDEDAKNCRETKKYKSFGSNVKPSLCETMYSTGSGSYKSALNRIEELKNDIDIKQNSLSEMAAFFKNNESPKVHWVQIRYIPIFENINKIKVIQEKKNTFCFNPSLSLKAMSFYSDLPKPYSMLENKICEKFAKFE